MLKVQLNLKEWIIPNRYYSVNFNDLSLVSIDSNLVKTEEYEPMRNWLSSIITELKTAGKQYYYIQHEPFISFKKKKITFIQIAEEYKSCASLNHWSEK
jgi:hypothetical protein